jgi:ubiquinone/menaquinone biosynthesis C-methylase UbiE
MGTYERFGKYYDLIYEGIVDYGKETSALEKIFAQLYEKKPKTILDVGCGTGTHAIILTERGYDVAGIDVSENMIQEARKKARQRKTKVEFFVQDMRKIELHKKFDCAICMFGGFGYILTYEDITNVFSGLRRHLNTDGLFIYEFWNVGGLKPSPYQTWLKIQNNELTLYRLSESNFDPLTNILNIDFHFIITRKEQPAETFDETHKIRCYTLTEMRKYLEDNGFELVRAYDWSVEDVYKFESPGKDTFRTLIIARRT